MQASQFAKANYLGDWVVPTLSSAAADFVVDPGGHGTHLTIQAAVDAVPTAANSAANRRWSILIRAGLYREAVCIADKAPLAIVGVSTDRVRIVEGRYAALGKSLGVPAHPCVPNLGSAVHGTSGSTTFAVFSSDVLMENMTIENDAVQQSQAVALTIAADRVALNQLSLLGHQDTFYVRRSTPGQPARVFVRNSLIAGDVDFVFGNATLVIEHSELRSRARRVGGYVLAPSTTPDVEYGFLVTKSRFTAERGVAPSSVAIGRAWDQGVAPGTWLDNISPNGHALVRESEIGPHIAPWAASTSKRAFNEKNRLFEWANTELTDAP